jgi:multidrug transporter EmrE-like cation transporter
MSPYLAIALSIAFTISGQLLLKRGMGVLGQLTIKDLALKAITSPWVIIGLGVYVCGVVCWTIALSQRDLSFVYPFSSLSYAGIMLGSYFLFKERISRVRLLGIGVIIVGLLIISLSGTGVQ